MRIYLIGMPGCGKSTVGHHLAEALNYNFLDLDQAIEEKEGNSIPDIFSTKGEDYFRKIEKEVLETTLPENTVIATGGGAPCFFNNMGFIKEQGLAIFLDTPTKLLAERVLQQKGSRPLVDDQQSLENVQKALEEKRNDRLAFYMQADYRIDTSEGTPLQLSERISAFVSKHC
ncbi:shikimate kinase [Algivirga pacifica]|uniref:Shikimate kinase n=1 Tax=Algivirga pacifica TaxID=1162670 RepID=A0ABP9D5A7_9BACT